jgi:hypothetical protein
LPKYLSINGENNFKEWFTFVLSDGENKLGWNTAGSKV